MSRSGNRTAAGRRLGNWIAPPRFLVFLVLFGAVSLGWHASVPGSGWADAATMGFDFAAAVFIASLWPLFSECSPERLRTHSRENDANRLLVLIVTTLVTAVVMAAIAGELPQAKAGDLLAMVKLTGTLLMIWLFANLVYTLHYAHYYYATEPENGGDVGGLEFKGTSVPDYSDFAYFAFTLGMTFQTSDVTIRAQPLRHVALLHSFAAFIFNIGVIAFTINAIGNN